MGADRVDIAPYVRGIRVNLAQFGQQAIRVFLVGLRVGMEHTVLSAQGTFGVLAHSYSFPAAFVASFDIVKGLLNFYAGRLGERNDLRQILLFGWVVGPPIPFLILFATNCWWIIRADGLLGANQGCAWPMTITSQADLAGARERGLAGRN